MIDIGKIFGWVFGAVGVLCLILAITTWSSLSSSSIRATELEKAILNYGGAVWLGSGISSLFFSWVSFAICYLLKDLETSTLRVSGNSMDGKGPSRSNASRKSFDTWAGQDGPVEGFQATENRFRPIQVLAKRSPSERPALISVKGPARLAGEVNGVYRIEAANEILYQSNRGDALKIVGEINNAVS